MSKREVTLTRAPSGTWLFPNGEMALCRATLRRHVSVPKAARSLHIKVYRRAGEQRLPVRFDDDLYLLIWNSDLNRELTITLVDSAGDWLFSAYDKMGLGYDETVYVGFWWS